MHASSFRAAVLALLALAVPAELAAQAGGETFVIPGEGIAIDGERFAPRAWSIPNAPGEGVSVGFAIDDEPLAMNLWRPGCVLRSGWVYTLEESSEEEPPWARIVRARAPSRARSVGFGSTSTVHCGETLRFRDGTRVLIEAIEGRNAEFWQVRLRVGAVSLELAAQPIAASSTPAEDVVIVLSTTDERGPAGQPRVALQLTRPSLVVVAATDGEVVVVPAAGRVRLGRLFVRYGPCATGWTSEGEAEALCQLSATLGARRFNTMLGVNQPWDVAGHRVVLLSSGDREARLQISVTDRGD